MKHWIFLGVAIVGEVIATSAMKASDGFSNLVPSLILTGGYVVAFYFLSLALRAIPVGIAYAIWAGLGVVLVAVIASITLWSKVRWRRYDWNESYHIRCDCDEFILKSYRSLILS